MNIIILLVGILSYRHLQLFELEYLEKSIVKVPKVLHQEPEIYVPINSSNLKSSFPRENKILYSTLCKVYYSSGSVGYVTRKWWIAHVLLTIDGVYFTEPRSKRGPIESKVASWKKETNLSHKGFRVRKTKFTFIREPMYESIEKFNERTRQFYERFKEFRDWKRKDLRYNKLRGKLKGFNSIPGDKSEFQITHPPDLQIAPMFKESTGSIKVEPIDIIIKKEIDELGISANFTSLIQEGMRLHSQSKNEEAIKLYEEAIKLDQYIDIPWFNMGNAYFDMKNYIKAIECFDRALDLNPNNFFAKNSRKMVLEFQFSSEG